mgnify:CR=1 FL=1|tara:strand:+ start:3841 stop:4692 length:852 start_codon:yes stop_codon:yes gene_type:complete
MKISLFTLYLFVLFLGNAQADLNQYKYIIVPKKFDGFKNENQYQTSTLLKYLFVENGFTAVYDDALPDDLNRDRCIGAILGIKDDSGMFATKLTLTLKDCQSKVVFESQEGVSKKKDYKSAYDEAIRSAFLSFKGINYAYAAKVEQEAPVKISFKNDVKQIKETDAKKPDHVVEVQKDQLELQNEKEVAPVVSNVEKVVSKKELTKGPLLPPTVLYAQVINNGYQLVDATPKIILKMLKSTLEDVFIAESLDLNGLVYKRNNKWYFEYNKDGKVVVEELQIKF